MNLVRENMSQLRKEMNEAIRAVCSKHGLSFEIGAITYDPGDNCRFRVTVRQSNVGRVGSPWASNAITVKPGDTIRWKDKVGKYIGPYSGRRYKHLVAYGAKRYKMTDEQIRAGLVTE